MRPSPLRSTHAPEEPHESEPLTPTLIFSQCDALPYACGLPPSPDEPPLAPAPLPPTPVDPPVPTCALLDGRSKKRGGSPHPRSSMGTSHSERRRSTASSSRTIQAARERSRPKLQPLCCTRVSSSSGWSSSAPPLDELELEVVDSPDPVEPLDSPVSSTPMGASVAITIWSR